jgi:hypothetical protein
MKTMIIQIGRADKLKEALDKLLETADIIQVVQAEKANWLVIYRDN